MSRATRRAAGQRGPRTLPAEPFHPQQLGIPLTAPVPDLVVGESGRRLMAVHGQHHGADPLWFMRPSTCPACREVLDALRAEHPHLSIPEVPPRG